MDRKYFYLEALSFIFLRQFEAFGDTGNKGKYFWAASLDAYEK